VAADAYANLLQLSFPAETVDEIRLHHVFEHFNRVTALSLLIKWHEWLKPGGTLRLETPDLVGSAKYLIAPGASWKTKMGAARHLAGDQADGWAYHLEHWFPERFEHTLAKLGFENIETSTRTWNIEPYLANVEVTARKVPRSRNEQIAAAEELLWESTVANAERPTFEVWKRQLSGLLKDSTAPHPTNSVAPRAAASLITVIFSKDRPLQLDALLRSFALHCRDLRIARVRVLYTTSDPKLDALYEQVARENGWAQFIRERDFRAELRGQIRKSDYVLFLVDDTLFVRDFSLTEIMSALAKESDAGGFSLRLGRNTTYCYSLDRTQSTPEFLPVCGSILKYKWPGADSDFGYPLEVSSSVYRARDLAPLLAGGEFTNPNSLEAWLAKQTGHFELQPFLLCFEQSAAFSAPVNKVQSVNRNRAGADPANAAEALSRKFSEGQRVDVAAFSGFVPRACHEEVELKFTSRSLEQPLVSVVIPCYNQAQYLPDAVASVLAQTYKNWEVIIVNDGSPDDTSEVARRLAAQSPNTSIRLVEQRNLGLAQARNAGIKSTSGRYILPLDADDKIAPAMLEKAVSCLETDPAIAIVYTDALYFGSQNYEQPTMDYDFATLCYQNHLNYCSLFRREAWERVGGYNPNMIWGYEDWDFWIGCGEAGFFARHVAQPLLHYRVKGESMFTRALTHDLELRAQIVLNHPRLYNETSQSWAREILKSAGSATAEGAEPHEILRREHLLTELQGLKAEYKKSNAKWQQLQVQWQARHADLYASEVECQARFNRLKEAHERCQSALASATEGGPAPAWMRRMFEKTLPSKFRTSIRKRLGALRGAFEDPATTPSK
jgi:hypothetical protein